MVFLMKVVIVGDQGVGKRRFLKELEGSSVSYFETHGFQPTLSVRTIEDREVRFQLWVLNPKEKFLDVRKTYYIGALGAIIIFDVNKYETFESVSNWIYEIWSGAGNDIPIVLLGNNNFDEAKNAEIKIKVNYFTKQLMINEKEGIITLKYMENMVDERKGFENALNYLGLQYFYNFERKKIQ